MSEDIEEIEGGARKGTGGLMFVTVSALIMAVAITVLGYMTQIESETLALNNWTEFLGDLHPVVLHLPIGVFMLVLMMELAGLLSFGKWKPQTAFPLFIGVISAVVAVIFGCLLLRQGNRTLDEAFWHMWASIGFTVVGTLAFLAKIWANHSGTKSPIYGILLMITVGLLGWSGLQGGDMTHGDPFGPFFAKTFGEGAGDDAGGGEGDPEQSKPPEERLVYEEIIVPILESKCYECHAGADKNPKKKKNIKGKFEMTSMELLKKGGGSKAPGITPGDLEDSAIHFAIELPIDDEEHMPPEKKEQLTKDEKAIIYWWITAGAPVGKVLKDLSPPAEILEGVANLVPPEERLKQQKAAAAAKAKAEQELAEQKAKVKETMEEVRKVFPNALRYVSQDSSDLTFNAVSMRSDFKDEDLAKLNLVGEWLVELEIGSTAIGDSGVAQLVSMPNLQRLKLNNTTITDAALDTVAKLGDLEYLNLVSTAVTDEGLKKIEGLTKLRKLYLWQSKATKAGVDALKAKLPDCEINIGVE